MATMNTIDLNTAKAFLTQHFPQGGKVLCALSGGLDSMCLTHFLLSQEGFEVAAAHFNHRLRGEASDADQFFVENWCMQHRVPFFVGEGDTRAHAAETGKSMEEAARDLRYEFLTQVAEENGFDAILTAHHADDNAETVLLNLLRGTGTAGLGGIPAVRGNIYRPFLSLTRETLAAYAAEHGIPHVEDATNEEEIAARNILRRRVMPVLRDLNPRAAEHISRAAAIAAADSGVLDALAAETAAQGTAEALRSAPEAVASRAALLLLGQAAGGRKDLTAVHAAMLLDLARAGRGEAHFPRNVHARVSSDGRLILWRQEERAETLAIKPGQSVLWGHWRVSLREDSGGSALTLPEDAALSVTGWESRDRMTLPGSRGSRSVKRLCADHGISPMERDTLPVLRVGEQAAAMAHLGVNLEFAPQNDQKTVYIRFEKTTKGDNT